MRVTAVVCSYWEQRRPNISRIVSDLAACSRPPDRIIVLDNNWQGGIEREVREGAEDGSRWVDIVEGGTNWECRGKFVTALLDPADYYVLMDDDTSVGHRTIEALTAAAERHGGRGFVSGYWGVRLVDGQFMGGQIVCPAWVSQDTRVDAFHGRVMFMAYDALVRMLAVEEWVRCGDMAGKWPSAGDDIIAGLANDNCWLLPLRDDECFVDLDECGVSMQSRVDRYFESRDEFTADVLRAVAEHGRPAW